MEATTKVKIKSLEPYRHLFPKALVLDKTIKKGASVEDTVHFIPEVVRKTAWQVEKYVDQELSGLSLDDACKKLWHFVKYHIEYRPDKFRVEQVRSPRRLIHDGFGDCDCGTTFIMACLYVMKIPVTRRITKYKEDRFQHIYPVIELKNGKVIIMDFVVHAFNYEEPYSEKQDYKEENKMDLQFLDGIEANPELLGVDAKDLFGEINDIGELGQLLRRAKKSGGGSKPGLFKKKTPEQKSAKKAQRKEKFQKVANKVNKLNAGAALLRAGILASMKLNIMKVAERIKWGYASKDHAVSKGMEPATHDKLKQVLARAEKIFFTAGGKPENLKKAILTGRGNRNKDVAGVDGYSENSSLPDLLGAIYQDEFNGLDGFEELGVVTAAATTASITAATGVMAAIATLLKQTGTLFPKKEGEGKKKGMFKRKGSDSGEQEQSTDSSSESSETESSEQSQESSEESESTESGEAANEETTDNVPAVNEENLPATTEENSSEEVSTESSGEEEGASGLLGLEGIKDFWQKNKKWIIPVGIIGTAITLGLIINHYANKSEQKQLPTPQPALPVNGVDGTKKRRSRKGGKGRSNGKQSVIALM